MKSASIMIVENNHDLRNTLRHAFEDRGYVTWTCPTQDMALSIFAAIQPDIVILDLDLEWLDPMGLIEAWKELSPHTRIIVESASADPYRMHEAVTHGAQAFLIKPYSIAPLFEMLEQKTPPGESPNLNHRAVA